MLYKAFMSYSHAADDKLAPALQSALHRFAKPWYRMRAMRVFRDKTSLSANPALWPSIEKALSESEYFLLLASPQAAQSPWVKQEITWWLTNRSSEKMLILVTNGDLVWDVDRDDFDWNQTTVLPSDLRDKFEDEPLYVDLRWAKTADNLSLRHSQFRGAVLDIAASLHGRPKDDLDGEDVRQHKKTKKLAWSVGIALFALTIASGVATYNANKQSKLAFSRELAASATLQLTVDPELSLLLAMESARVSPTPQAEDALRQSLLASHILRVMRGHSGIVTKAEFNPDGQLIVTASADGTAQVWETATGKRIAILKHEGKVNSATFSPDGMMILTASSDHTARLWKVGTWQTLHELTGHKDEVNSAIFSPDGKLVITISKDWKARVWDIITGKNRGDPFGTINPISSAVVSPDSRLLAMTGGVPLVWDIGTGKIIGFLYQGAQNCGANNIAFSPDGRLLLIACHEGVVDIWEIPKGTSEVGTQMQIDKTETLLLSTAYHWFGEPEVKLKGMWLV